MGSRMQFPGIFLEGRGTTLTQRNVDRFSNFFHFFHSLDRDKNFSYNEKVTVITQKCVNLTVTRDPGTITNF